MADEDDHPAAEANESREPTLSDVRDLCRELNARQARYIVVGGFAMSALGYNRRTMDIDLLVDTTGDNETRVIDAVATLPDGAASEIKPGEIAQWTVVRIADEIVVDLMSAGCGIDYAAGIESVVTHEVDGIAIPFAGAALLWRMKKPTGREKDIPDLLFLREWFAARGIEPPAL